MPSIVFTRSKISLFNSGKSALTRSGDSPASRRRYAASRFFCVLVGSIAFIQYMYRGSYSASFFEGHGIGAGVLLPRFFPKPSQYAHSKNRVKIAGSLLPLQAE